ncbi:DinB family protein [Larkinella soli]|uniref:DinB family protein n=1 Tax=Larkinella soli TaxID=1770527 RepID=UPI0035B5CBE3
MKKNSLFVALALMCWLTLSSFSTGLTPKTVSQMVTEWERAKAYTKEYLDVMPEDGMGYKPNPEIRSFAEQMLHLANANYAFASAASGKANPNQGKNLEKMDDMKSKANLTKAVMDSYDFVIEALKGMNDSQLAEKGNVFGREMQKEMIFAKAFEHQTHHRGQATIYIRMKGIKPPNEKLF